ncbi:type III secretion system translocon subunit SctE [Klebsiella sp. BIGb0407]|uniref:type III secretion system translocon subunit SctE n=1 Tax=Klebsiella sp. BIGb0407 TaxID=2940603 RepID=UPI0021685376|nr:type III secretion system translocon subunit SctE [Klebsiella sp. BIGb0407]MCS3431537.1 invasin B [Klebsiella sp. BIGb0407]
MSIRTDNFDYIDNSQALLDINQQQLKRQSEQAKRFVNSAIKDHPQLDNIKGALQVLQPKQLISVLENTRDAINGNGGTVNLIRQEIPLLSEPNSDTDNTTMHSSARMLELLGKINQLTSDSSLQKQLNQLKTYNASMAGAESSYSELAAALESQGEQWANNSDALKQAQGESTQLEKEVKSAESDLKNKQSALTKLETQAQEQDPVSSELNQQIDDARKEVIAAQANVDKKTQIFNQHTKDILNPAVKAENSSRQALDNTLDKSRALTNTTPVHQQAVIENQRKQNDQQSKSLTFLMALISQLIDNSASNDLKAAAELKVKLSEAAAKDSDKKAKEYEDSVRKAEEMQKVMGCIGKILGWVITIASVAAAVFTGGASLVFATIGLALAIGDEINQAVNGVSFMAQAMKPLMDAVIQPMMELLGSVYAKILETMGVDKSTAQMIGQIMGAIATAIIMVAAVVVAGSVASKLSSAIAKRVGSKVMDKIMNNVVMDVLKRIGQGVGRSVGMQEAKIAQIAARTEMGLAVANLGNTAIQTAGNIVVADMKVDAAKMKAHLLNNTALQELLNIMLERAVDAFKTRMESTNEIIKKMSSVTESNMQTGLYITKRMSTVAG